MVGRRWVWGVVLLSIFIAQIASLAPTYLPNIPETSATFPGTNGKIAFVRLIDGNNEIYVMNADGTDQTRLTDNPAGDVSPDWSPDGTKMVFDSNRDDPNHEIYVMNADGTGQTRLTNSLGIDNNPSWSPDGTKIAFNSNRDGNLEIYVMNADGTGQTNLSNNAAIDAQPSWSPDGTKIAFNSNRDGNLEIYVMNADGTGQTRLTNNPAHDGGSDWSPDGTKIVFQSDRDGLGFANVEIYVMNSDGTAQTRLTNIGGFDGAPSWSPDGTKIAFQSSRGPNTEIYVMNADGTGQTNITNNPAFDGEPDWQPLSLPVTLALSQVQIKPSGAEKIQVQGEFTLDARSDGIDPVTEPVSLKLFRGDGTKFYPTLGNDYGTINGFDQTIEGWSINVAEKSRTGIQSFNIIKTDDSKKFQLQFVDTRTGVSQDNYSQISVLIRIGNEEGEVSAVLRQQNNNDWVFP